MLYEHQISCIKFAIANSGRVAIYHDPGLGKTRTALEIFQWFKTTEPKLRMLVVCPLSLINAAWGVDAQKFTTYKYIPYSSLNHETPDIIGINYESLIVKSRYTKILQMLSSGDWLLCIDESSRLKNHKGVTTKAILKLPAKYKLLLSGTPAPNTELEFWAQAKFLKPDSLPDSFYAFRNIYFHLGRGKQMMSLHGKILSRGMMSELFSHGWKYEITPQNREALMERLKPFCHWVKKEDALDLPEKIDEIREITLNPNERKAYNEMLRHLVAEIKQGYGKNAKVDEIIANVALAKLQKLRQITSGFAYTDEHIAVRPGRSSKMRELKNIIEEVVGNRQCIIWINFREEVAAISGLLKEMGLKFVTLYAETEDKDFNIKSFQDGQAQILLANSQSAGHGLTFTNCSICIYFSLSYSWEQYEQSRNRVHRIGQKNNCLYIHLIAQNTIDEGVLQVLNRKKTLQDLIYQLMQEED